MNKFCIERRLVNIPMENNRKREREEVINTFCVSILVYQHCIPEQLLSKQQLQSLALDCFAKKNCVCIGKMIAFTFEELQIYILFMARQDALQEKLSDCILSGSLTAETHMRQSIIRKYRFIASTNCLISGVGKLRSMNKQNKSHLDQPHSSIIMPNGTSWLNFTKIMFFRAWQKNRTPQVS